MRNMLWLLISIALLLGCSSKEQKILMQNYKEEITYHKQLLKTEKVQLYDGNITTVMLTATYLNRQSINKKESGNERFIVGIYDEESEGSLSLSDGEYTLHLNGHLPKKIKALKKEDTRLKHISFVSEWSHFYLIEFPHSSHKSLTLVLKSNMFGKGKLHFAKVAKYILKKKVY
jgi:hypothetical protein